MQSIIWNLSLIFAAMSVAIMVSLIVLRARDDWQQGKLTGIRKKLRLAYIGFSADNDRIKLHQAMLSAPSKLVIDVSFEFLGLVRGQEKESLEAELMMTVLPKLIRESLARGNEAERIEAARQIGSFKSFETIQSLKKALSDRSPSVRLSAAISLGRMGEVKDLDQILSTIGREACRSREVRALLRAVPSEDADVLRQMATDKGVEPNLRAAAVITLADLGGYSYLPCFEGLARDPVPDVAVAALEAIGKFAHPSTAKTVLSCMASENWRIRLEAARVAGIMGADNAITKLSELMSDEEWAVRYAAASSLLALGDRGRNVLVKLSQTEASESQHTASMVLDEAVTG